ncbi:hypothetical protein CIN_04430 [Commensalibacter intestini A911]|uniref:Uncharacterized protein n=1 Tax=Commensalibacter intestini A911 TaxID=1088868 RepID=G6EYC3_9PROT|nr:hypothetical protein CIN_04430 [Commensalibacter intestini A911]
MDKTIQIQAPAQIPATTLQTSTTLPVMPVLETKKKSGPGISKAKN